jgi:hypothetical protein
VFDHLFFQDRATLETFWTKGKEYIGQVQCVDHQKSDSGLILNFGQPPLDQYLLEGRQSGICSRCLSEGHPRWACKAPIRCFVCRHEGHVALNCPDNGKLGNNGEEVTTHLNGKALLKQAKQVALGKGSTLG